MKEEEEVIIIFNNLVVIIFIQIIIHIAKAGGDKMGKDKIQPYAYLPLDPRFLNKKKKQEAPRQYSNIVNSVKQQRKESKKRNRNEERY